MACASCEEQKRAERQAAMESAAVPMNANDIMVVDNGEVRPFTPEDWPQDMHKLLIFYPQTFTPVCKSELGALNDWIQPFADLNCRIIAVCSDPAEAITDWYKASDALHDLRCLTFSSYLLPSRLNIVAGGRSKRASVFMMADGEIVKQEHFQKVGRSLAELHRMMFGYSTDSYCAEGWQPPEVQS